MGRLWAAGLVFLAAGCSASDDPARFYPPEDRARQALEAALAAWQQGAQPGTVPGSANPRVEFVDSHNGPGRRLKAYTVLGLAPGDGPRVFTVQLSLDSPTADLRVRYYVIGIDPVWVIRQEDYDMLNHWEHHHGP
ncbi:MAG TPA: hypothetical protein VKD90_18135, partial [Gemmataceae bacterium]|nr:hypothetical protein [Gemmataceae bacterium]